MYVLNKQNLLLFISNTTCISKMHEKCSSFIVSLKLNRRLHGSGVARGEQEESSLSRNPENLQRTENSPRISQKWESIIGENANFRKIFSNIYKKILRTFKIFQICSNLHQFFSQNTVIDFKFFRNLLNIFCNFL